VDEHEAKEALHVLYSDVNRKVLQMGSEIRASGLVGDRDALDLREVSRLLRREMCASEPEGKDNLPYWLFARKHLGAEIARLEALVAEIYPGVADAHSSDFIVREFIRDGGEMRLGNLSDQP
jgi:hypothetical protein